MMLALQLVTYFSSEHLPRLFASLRAQTFQGWKLYVRDQSQQPEEQARVETLLRESGIAYEFSMGENLGFAAGHNRLFALHQAPFVALVNPDIVFEPTYYEQILQAFEQYSSFDSLQGVLLHTGDEGKIIDSLGLKVLGFGDVRDLATGQQIAVWQKRFATQSVMPVFGVAGAAPVYRRSALAVAASTHGGFLDERFFLYKEDVELAVRLYRSGARAGLVPAARAEHVRTLMRRSIWSRFQNEFQRPAVIRISNYANQWRIYLLHAEWNSSPSAWMFSLVAEAGRSVGLLLLSPRAFLKAWREIKNDLRSLRASRTLYHQQFSHRWLP